jgi:hypothetical protein
MPVNANGKCVIPLPRLSRRDSEWTDLMRSANAGDNAAYHRLMKWATPVLRAKAQQ